jgi:hypothetical protein
LLPSLPGRRCAGSSDAAMRHGADIILKRGQTRPPGFFDQPARR